MPNTRTLREIVMALRRLVWQARDGGSSVAGDVVQMAARAVQDIAAAGRDPV